MAGAAVTLLVEGRGIDAAALESAAGALPDALPGTVARATAGERDVAESGDAGRLNVILAPVYLVARLAHSGMREALRTSLVRTGEVGCPGGRREGDPRDRLESAP